MNTFMNELKNVNNFDRTENGDLTHKTTNSAILDMFGIGGAYRNRSETDVITLFKDAFSENRDLAMKCLFYLRDVRGGQGERRFFRVAYQWLCDNYPAIALKNLIYIPEYGRWDDLIYIAIDTKLQNSALSIIAKQLAIDIQCKTPSLLGKWMPSQNASSPKTKAMGKKLAKYLGLSPKQYRVLLSTLRKRINIVEVGPRDGFQSVKGDEIEFDKIPSRAGILYKNAFARKDIIAEKYRNFIKSNSTKVNARTLYPQDIARKASGEFNSPYNSLTRMAIQKYWDNLPDYYQGRKENGIAVVDVSGSMIGTPMEAAISLGAYIADKAHGPFAHHFITFSERPELVHFTGADIVDKFRNCISASWGFNTDIKKVFDMLLSVAKKSNVSPEDMPSRIYIFSDMEFDECVTLNSRTVNDLDEINTGLESIQKEWENAGYKMPSVIFWNLDARSNHIPAIGGNFSYVSGFSPVMISQILGGKKGYELMIEKLINSGRYDVITG